MNRLIINTAFDIADYIVIKDNQIYYEKTQSYVKHSETSLNSIVTQLEKANISVKDLDYIAVNLGPGSFTGIRIGVSIAKGFLCANENIKAIGFDSFAPLHYNNSTSYAIKASNQDCYFVKQVKICKNEIEIKQNEELDENVIMFDCNYDISDLINLCDNLYTDKNYVDINELIPIYVKPSQAEKELLKKEKINDN